MLALRVSLAVAAMMFRADALAAETARCTLPNAGDWREYRSKHFIVDTDVSRSTAGRLVDDLERIHALELKALVGEVVDIPGHIRVIAFGRPRDFETVSSHKNAGSYSAFTSLGEPTIVLPVERLSADPENVAFQVANRISPFLFPRQPPWFRIGLAMFVQTVATDTDLARAVGSQIQVGQRAPRRAAGLAPRNLVTNLKEVPAVSAREILEWNGRTEKGDDTWFRYNEWSWMLYHWLWNNRSKPFSDLQQRLSAGEDPTAAWRAAFPDLQPTDAGAMASLDKALEAYRRGGRYAYYTVSAEYGATYTDAALPSADLHVVIADVRRSWPDRKDEADALRRSELEEALREDPTHPVAIFMKMSLEHTSPVQALREAVAKRPRDWRAPYLLAAALTDKADAPEKESALRKTIALEPDSAGAHNSLAWLLATSGRAREALPFANRAVDLAPWSAPMVDTLAAVAIELGKCKEALVLQRRAVEAFAAKDPQGEPERKHLADYERRCAADTAAR